MGVKLPAAYAWLEREPGPKMLREALKLYGTVELAGAADSPTIMGWARETGVRGYTADSVPWCGLFMAVVAKRAGKPVPKRPLWALNWGTWGEDGGQPELGDVLTFIRHIMVGKGPGWRVGGHVGFYVGEDDACYHVLGGNQRDAVSITRIDKDRLRACRQPVYKRKPPNVRPIILRPDGAVSTNEA